MGKDKLRKFRENQDFALLHQPAFEDVFRRDFHLKGKWNESFFHNNNPIVLELGCGKGEYTVALARKYPEKNFIGVDIKGARLWRGAKTATEEHLPNVSFLRTRIDFIESFFAAGEVSEIWITFPDPQPNSQRKRLTSTMFLSRYRNFLKRDGIVQLKTDSQALHLYTKDLVAFNQLELLEANNDIYGSGRADELLSIKTHYEQIYLQRAMPITYIKFKIDGNALLSEPEEREKSV